MKTSSYTFRPKFSLLISFLVFLIVSCSKAPLPDPTPILSDDCTLSGISFNLSQNTGMTEQPALQIIDNLVHITVNVGVNIAELNFTCNISPKSVINIDGAEQSSSTIKINCTNEKEISVISESKLRTTKYKFLVKTGNPQADQLAYNFMKKFEIPGMSFAVSKNEQVAYSSAVGYAVKDLVRTRTDHLFRLASCSKPITAICVMTQIEEGKYGINDKVFGSTGLLPEFTATGNATNVTVRHLLEHTSGWPNASDAMFNSACNGMSVDQRIVYTLGTISQTTTPGVTHSYLNMGYLMLGKIIEKFSGKGYEDYMRTIMAKAGVTDIWVGASSQALKRTNEVVYYSQDGRNGYGNEMAPLAAAGGLICSTGEMLKIMFAVDGLNSVTSDILSPATRTLMLTPVGYSRYAMGWRANYPSANLANTFYHAGNLAGTAPIWFLGTPANGHKNAVVLMNSRNYASTFDDEQYDLISQIAARF